ncbi:PCMT-domain-containing protein [Coccomyxa subellipsoidea C-169]|uniref:protein-L-isoaspartate(D-aspartate) O-methyltransferase n=1 Tax=Coccomyxa subellipsoidea (strain C-169) TaxID=574566 RepID=I0Z988_COCSC|nr:PCMT-domain-containing protein [Coccomyxa subellipsoidea C-169]EIE27207.1 PCMT-domain-containing protein [Coccomyxa subellipsoidea C-169]|eukprot:XP_005651751.1 PCMT-domain-containing protein [Coccomyxa subellipsoidea C-169]
MNAGEEALEAALLHRHERPAGRAPVRGERPVPMAGEDDGNPLGLRAIGLMPMMMSDDDDSEDEGDQEALDEDDDAGDEHEGAHRPHADGPIQLHQFLRFIAGRAGVARDRPHGTNDDLINNLRRMGVLSSEKVIKAMRLCPRNAFLPEAHRNPDEAFLDSPVRLDTLDFNVSAPHMHATCLQELDLQPGHRFLDVGSGCGIVTACAALLVGKMGRSAGIDVKRAAVQLGRSSVAALARTDAEYATKAADVRFFVHNVFMPSLRHKGQYDRVHCGAACPPSKLVFLLELLRPEGGLIVTPVEPSDLRVLVKAPDGSVRQRIISQVPSDAEMLLSTIKMERRAQLAIPPLPSTFAADVAAITGSPGTSAGSCMSEQSAFGMDDADGERRWPWPKKVAQFLSACSGSQGSSGSEGSGSGFEGSEEDSGAVLDADELGSPDCTLIGATWHIPARCVLRVRCEHFRARCDSGMRDASDSHLPVPDHFSQEAMEVFKFYLYNDQLDARLDAEAATAVLHIGQYYGAPRLVGLCERMLAREIRHRDAGEEGTCEAAAALLGLADEAGLPHLRAVALDFVVQHFPAVSATPAWAALPRSAADAVAAEAAARFKHSVDIMRGMAAQYKTSAGK